jgi:hypothetical protein
MAKISLPYEVKASFRVPRRQAETLVSKFKRGIAFPGLLPDALKSSDAGIESDSIGGTDDAEAAIWVLFRPRNQPRRFGPREDTAPLPSSVMR